MLETIEPTEFYGVRLAFDRPDLRVEAAPKLGRRLSAPALIPAFMPAPWRRFRRLEVAS